MKNVRFPVFSIFAIPVICFGAFGCSGSTTPSGASLPSVPPIGSTLTEVSSSAGLLDTSQLTVASTAMTDPNSSGATVLKYIETIIGVQDSTFQSLEPNGDVALKGEAWDETGNFYVLPFATTASIQSSYVGVAGTVDLVALHDGPGANYPLNGRSYATDSATLLYILASDTTQYHYSFIPSLGIMARMSEVPSAQSGQDPSSYWISSYSPK